MKFKPYEEYKEVDLPWLDRVPSHWEMRKVKYKFNLVKDPSTNKNPTVLSLTQKGIKIRDIESNEGQLAKSYEGYNTIKKGYICLNPMDLESGAASKSDYDGVISNAYFTIRPKNNDINTDFYSRYFNLHYKKKIFYGFGKGVGRPEGSGGRWTLNRETFINFPIVFPPKEEQDKIVEFLDENLEKIDRFIELRERQIELFQEEKEVIINNAVTKGIDKTVEYKDSSIDWIGEIPEHWEVIRLKYVADIVNGGTPNSSNVEFWNGDIYWVTPKDLSKIKKYILDSERKITELGYNNCSTSIVPENNIIMATRAPIGNIRINKIETTINQGCKGIIIYKDKVNVEFMYFLLNAYVETLKLLGNGATFVELSTSSLAQFHINIPPLSEQKEIVAHIEKETSKIDKTIDLYKKQIDLIKEYRTSLIAQAVTGKIDVRNF